MRFLFSVHRRRRRPLHDYMSDCTRAAGCLWLWLLSAEESKLSHSLVTEPIVLETMDAVLLPNCDDYQLHVATSLVIGPGARSQVRARTSLSLTAVRSNPRRIRSPSRQVLHREDAWDTELGEGFMYPDGVGANRPRKNLIVAGMWAMSDFTPENGATLIVPGSVGLMCCCLPLSFPPLRTLLARPHLTAVADRRCSTAGRRAGKPPQRKLCPPRRQRAMCCCGWGAHCMRPGRIAPHPNGGVAYSSRTISSSSPASLAEVSQWHLPTIRLDTVFKLTLSYTDRIAAGTP